MARSTNNDAPVAGSAFVEMDLDLPDVELHPTPCEKIATVESASVKLSQAGKPMIVLKMRVSPEHYSFGYDRNNAPDGIVSTIYISRVGFGHDLGALTGEHGHEGVSRAKKVFETLGAKWGKFMVGPREDLLGEIFISDEDLNRLVGKQGMVTLTEDVDLDNNPYIRFSKLAPVV